MRLKGTLKKIWGCVDYFPYICALLLSILAFPFGETYGVMAGMFLFFVGFMIIIFTSVIQREDK